MVSRQPVNVANYIIRSYWIVMVCERTGPLYELSRICITFASAQLRCHSSSTTQTINTFSITTLRKQYHFHYEFIVFG